MKRRDEWNNEDDKLLVSTVLQYIRTGKTQLQAFEDVGDKLLRTPAACGFRWNSNLRHKNIDQIILAKQDKLKSKMKIGNKLLNETLSLEDIIFALKQSVQALHSIETLKQSISTKIRSVSHEIERIKSELHVSSYQNRDALAKLIIKADELGLSERNKKPAI
ncbi:RsfA family transcriptional regulator [Paenibacillus silvae]|uniref:RsfA family transcriptional regulator n=1 Tax=Paenibacillus silvae TaxID=1325358 RepID=A0A2W6NNK2_9BACL|nr:RsfA family transcriptional regulator [Paenibacillus silvae]PZT57432.1 RsfA family transcriptional regulator [Paenibacillus silvae]